MGCWNQKFSGSSLASESTTKTMRERPLHYAAIAGCANAVQVGHLGHSGTTPGPKNNISGGLVGFKYCLTFQVDVGER